MIRAGATTRTSVRADDAPCCRRAACRCRALLARLRLAARGVPARDVAGGNAENDAGDDPSDEEAGRWGGTEEAEAEEVEYERGGDA